MQLIFSHNIYLETSISVKKKHKKLFILTKGDDVNLLSLLISQLSVGFYFWDTKHKQYWVLYNFTSYRTDRQNENNDR